MSGSPHFLVACGDKKDSGIHGNYYGACLVHASFMLRVLPTFDSTLTVSRVEFRAIPYVQQRSSPCQDREQRPKSTCVLTPRGLLNYEEL